MRGRSRVKFVRTKELGVMEAERTTNIKILIINLLLLCMLCALMVTGSICSGYIRQYSSVSLRFDTPISGRTAYAARQYSVTHSDALWPTFWTEYSASFSSEFVSANVDCIAFSGDAALVWPAEYIAGTAPGVIDGIGCAVSESLAWRLWGSTDVVGMTVEVDGTERTVRGIFNGKEELALLSFNDEDTSQSWIAAEFKNGSSYITRDDAERFASASGLGKPNSILIGNISFFASTLLLLPLLILAVYGLWVIIGYVGKRYPIARKLIPFLLLFLFTALLPILIGMLPEWVIPTRWSDFSFWGSQFTQGSNSLREFLRTAPQSRDVELRMLFIEQTGITFLAVCVSLAVCFRFSVVRGQGIARNRE